MKEYTYTNKAYLGIKEGVVPPAPQYLWLNSKDNKLYKFGNNGWVSISGAEFSVMGEYDKEKTYYPNSIVTYNGSSYISLISVPTYEYPTQNSDYWNLLAQKGEQGPQGNSGYSGNIDELEVVNNLIDGGENSALSAEQGKILKEWQDENTTHINKIKDGSVVTDNTLSALDETSNKPVGSKAIAPIVKGVEQNNENIKAISLSLGNPFREVSGWSKGYITASVGDTTSFNVALDPVFVHIKVSVKAGESYKVDIESRDWGGPKFLITNTEGLVTEAVVMKNSPQTIQVNIVEDGYLVVNAAQAYKHHLYKLVTFDEQIRVLETSIAKELRGIQREIIDVSTTTEGREYSHKIDVSIPAGASVCISIRSNGGIFKDDLIGSVSVQYTGSIVGVASSVSSISSDIRFVAEDDISHIKLTRSMTGVIGSGEVTVIVSYESSGLMGEIELLKRDMNKTSALYISPSGDDTALGTFAEPKKTVNACLDAGATKVLCMGGVYKQSIDASKVKNMTLELVKLSTNERVVFERPNSIIGESVEGVSGYSKVLQMSAPSTFVSSSLWLYQAGIADSETLINEVERYPMQRGLTHRCDATLIEHCTSTTLSDALTEIESSDKYLWFYDSGNRLIYLSCPTSVSTSNPIKQGSGSLFYNDTTGIAFKAVGIDVRYQNINLNGMRNAELIDCSSMYCGGVGGAFTWDNGIVKLTRCEAARCIAMASTGDGFNAHASKTGDSAAKTCIAELIDCWSHDNNDDGFSDHERAESVLRGGLFEYNKKGGVTPAYGSHCSCYGVISRKNYSGFLCTGEVTIDEGGNGTQLLCVDCVSLDNDRGYPNVGFNINGAGNKITLIRCMAIGCDTAFNVDESTSMDLYDCGTMNCTKVFNNKGTVRVNTTSLVASL